jgi:hypothetical protein
MNDFRKAAFLFFLAATMGLVFTGCENLLSKINEDTAETTAVAEDWNAWEEEFDEMGGERFGDFGDCFTFNFPLAIDCDSTVTTFNTNEELLAFLAANKPGCDGDGEGNRRRKRKKRNGGQHGVGFSGNGCDFVYPVTITMTSDSSTVSITTATDFQPVLQGCYMGIDSLNS